MLRALRLRPIVLALAIACSSCSAFGVSGPRKPVAPLTGLVGGFGAAFTKRPALAVKIENTPDARPQSGLEYADIVYEEPVEGGITRFLAIFQMQDPRSLGPVRSVRPEDAYILREYRAGLAYSGGAQYVLDLLHQTPGIVMINETSGGRAFHRVSFRYPPHNLYASAAGLWSKIASRAGGEPAPYFHYSLAPPTVSPTPSPAGSPPVRPGTQVSISYSTKTYDARWTYDPMRGRYLRFEGDVPHLTATGHQISAKNVLLMFVTTHPSKHLDAAGNSTPIVNMVGSGTIVLFRNGVRILGRWSRPAAAERTTFTTETGAPLMLAPGNTWIELVPRQIEVTY